MFRPIRSLLASVIFASASLAGCSSTGALDPAAIIAACQAACSFLPTTNSILALLNVNPTIATVDAAVGIVCSAFTAQVASDKLKGAVAGDVITFIVNAGNGKTVSITGTVVAK